MIDKLHIKRFKSIKDLSLNCKRINIFIGEPNTGKSNILEALGMLSFMRYSEFEPEARKFVRFERTSDLFHDHDLGHPIETEFDSTRLKLEFKNSRFEGQCNTPTELVGDFIGDHTALMFYYSGRPEAAGYVKFYRFAVRESFTRLESDFLLPPSGDNLLSLLMVNKELRSLVNQPFQAMGLRLGLRPHEGKIEVIKSVEDVIVSSPYSLASETFQRLTFYMAAILSNKNSVLVFEEPEAHAFPYYTNYLAEVIALDNRANQYFITTHNPYFLLPIVEKAPKDEVAVHLVYFEDYQTKVKRLSPRKMAELGEIDIFANIDRYLRAR